MKLDFYVQNIFDKVTHYFLGNKDNPISRFRTSCCALGQLSLNNDHTKEEIEEVLKLWKLETNRKWTTDNRDGGERAVFVVTTPKEKPLESTLRSVGFIYLYSFNRRNGYPFGNLKLWIYSW